MRPPSRSARLALLLPLAACLSPPTDAPGMVPVAGAWRYRAFAEAGSPAAPFISMEGTLALASVGAVRYQGTLSAVETAPSGTSARVTGTVSGRLVDGGTMDFTVTLPGHARAHVGAVRGDTITGRWLRVEADGMVSGGGRFEAVRP